MARTRFLAIAVLSLAASACNSAKRDFDRLCDLTGLYLADRGADREARRAEWERELTAKSWSEKSGMRDALTEASAANPHAKYSIFRNAARQAGLADWDCVALKDWLDEAARASDRTNESGTL